LHAVVARGTLVPAGDGVSAPRTACRAIQAVGVGGEAHEVPDELEDPTEVAQAVLGVAAAVAHREARVPGMDENRSGYDLPDLEHALDQLASTELLSGPSKAQVFSQVLQTRGRIAELEHLAASLVNPEPEYTPDQTQAIVDEIFATAEQALLSGGDVFHRQPEDLLDPTPLMNALRSDVRDFLVEFEPVDCEASVVTIQNTVALSITTTAYTSRPLAKLVNIVDPLEWPKCDLQHLFFQSMTKRGALSDLEMPDRSQPPPPLTNWKGTLREVVDWSFGAGWLPFTTDLDFVFFHRPVRVGCTYDLGAPVDHAVTVDQGYLLAEDLGTPKLRRVRTLKQVHFAIGDLDPEFVCCVWGPVMQILAWACIPD
jgi:hypothetical protein